MNQQILWALVAQTAVIVGGALGGILYNSARFTDLKDWIRAEVRRLDDRIDQLSVRIERIEVRMDKLEDRMGKLEDRFDHPVLRG